MTSVQAVRNIDYTKQLSRHEWVADWGNSTGLAKDALITVFVTYRSEKEAAIPTAGDY